MANQRCACFCTGFGGIVDALLDVGADVDVSTNDGWIPLHEACFNGHPDIAQRLIETGSQVSSAAALSMRTPSAASWSLPAGPAVSRHNGL